MVFLSSWLLIFVLHPPLVLLKHPSYIPTMLYSLGSMFSHWAHSGNFVPILFSFTVNFPILFIWCKWQDLILFDNCVNSSLCNCSDAVIDACHILLWFRDEGSPQDLLMCYRLDGQMMGFRKWLDHKGTNPVSGLMYLCSHELMTLLGAGGAWVLTWKKQFTIGMP